MVHPMDADELFMGGGRSRWLAVAVYVAGGLLALQLLAVGTQIGSEDLSDLTANWTRNLLMAGAAAMVVLRVAFNPQQRAAWSLIALGLIAWNAGDIYYDVALVGDGPIPYPSLTDAFYIGLYISFIGGLRLMGGRVRNAPVVSLGLVVPLLGLASLWSWLVFGGVLDAAEGTSAAIATTAAFPMLDLVLLASALLAVAASDWRPGRAYKALIAGFTLLAVGDLIYASQVAAGSYTDGSLVEVLWSASTVAVAVAAWQPVGTLREGIAGTRFVPVLTTSAAAVATLVLIWDQFDRVDSVTTTLASAALVAAICQLAFLFRDSQRARWAASASEDLRSASTEAALDCVVSIDETGIVREWNESACLTFGISRADAVGRDIAGLIIPPESHERHRAGLKRVTSGGESAILNRRIEMMALNAHGGRFPIELAVTQVQELPPIFTAFMRDISERRRREEENGRLAAIVRSSEDAILSKDLEGIVTAWNGGAEALYGYSAEEALGRRVVDLIIPADRAQESEQISRNVQKGGAVAFETERLTKLGTRIDVSLRAFAIRNLAGEVVGISTSSHDITERRRRHKEDLHDNDRRLWRGRIEEALKDDRLLFWGQPVVDLRSGTVHHHELLIRMELGGQIIGPNEFLPYAEACELITEIDHWAVVNGVRFARDVPVAINLSAKSLSSPRLVGQIQSTMHAAGVAPENLIFEITETAAAENLEAAHGLVQELTAMGCGVALDDFGTGYGSFTYLKHLPVTELKVDISFIRNLLSDANDRRVVSSMVSVASNFEMATVAEGVEDEVTLNLLREMGVDLVQGYHIGRPQRMRIPPARLATEWQDVRTMSLAGQGGLR